MPPFNSRDLTTPIPQVNSLIMPHNSYIRLTALCLLLIIAACSTVTTGAQIYVQDQPIDLRKFLREHPIAKDQDVRNDLIAAGPKTSVHIVQLRKSEKPHQHVRHDLRVVVIRGRGTMVIAGRRLSARVGSVFEIEKGKPHYFVNESPVPAAAVATFSPAFDGKDVVPVE